MHKFLVGVLALAAVSFGDLITYEFTPSNNGWLGNMSHETAYTWGEIFSLKPGETIESAVLHITVLDYINGGNSNAGANALYIDLLDDPAVSPDIVNLGDNTIGQSDRFRELGLTYDRLDRLNYNNGNWTSQRAGGVISSDWYINRTITFDATELANLEEYASDGTFGFGFDGDCHFDAESVKFVITTSTTNVPEPASLSLLGLGLLSLLFFRRKKQ